MIYPPSLVRLIEALRCLPGVGPKSAHHGLAADAVFQAMRHLGLEVAPPAAEVVVDVDDGNAGAAGLRLEFGDPFRHGFGEPLEWVALGEFEIVDDVDQEQSDGAALGLAAVQITAALVHTGPSTRQRCFARRPISRRRRAA